jgi:hypothetical protein
MDDRRSLRVLVGSRAVPIGIALPARIVALTLLAGCATSGTGYVVDCPLSAVEQQQAVQKIVPLGTSREQAAERLANNGIEFTTAAGDSIFYCSTWERPDGTRWHLNVALLFDQEHRLYRLREADTVALPDAGSTAASPNADSQGRRYQPSNFPGASGPPDSTSESDSIRTPFPGRANGAR